MAKAKLKDSDTIRQMQVDKLGTVYTWTLKHKTVKNLSEKDAADFEAGFAERARDFNQGKSGGEREVPAFSQAWWNGYQFALEQEP